MKSRVLKIVCLLSVVTFVLGAFNSCGAREETPAASPTLPTSLSLAI